MEIVRICSDNMCGSKDFHSGFHVPDILPGDIAFQVPQTDLLGCHSRSFLPLQAGVAIVEALGHLDVESLAAEQCQEVKDWHSRIFLGQGCVIHWPVIVPIKEDSVLLHQLAQSTVGSA